MFRIELLHRFSASLFWNLGSYTLGTFSSDEYGIIIYFDQTVMKHSEQQNNFSIIVTPAKNRLWSCTLLWGWKKLQEELKDEEVKIKSVERTILKALNC